MYDILFLQSLDVPTAEEGPLSQETCVRVSSASQNCSACSNICDIAGFGEYYF